MFKSISETKIADYATKAANNFLNAPNIPLDESIRKIAIDNDLTSDEIGRVVEAANKEVYLVSHARMDSKMFEFKLANAKVICESLDKNLPMYDAPGERWKLCTEEKIGYGIERVGLKGAQAEGAKTASEVGEGAGSVGQLGMDTGGVGGLRRSIEERAGSMGEVDKEKLANFLKKAEWMIGTEKQILEKGLEKLEMQKEKLEVEEFGIKKKIAEAITSFIKKAKSMALSGENLYAVGVGLVSGGRDGRGGGSERGEKYAEWADVIGGMLDHAMRQADLGNDRGGLGNDRGGLGGLSKSAGPVNQDWINAAISMSGQPVQIINGEHALCYDIDLLVDQSRSLEGCQQGLFRVSDEVDFVRRHLRNTTGIEVAKGEDNPNKEPNHEPSDKDDLINQYLTYGE